MYKLISETDIKLRKRFQHVIDTILFNTMINQMILYDVGFCIENRYFYFFLSSLIFLNNL